MPIRPYRLLGCAAALVLAAGTASAGHRPATSTSTPTNPQAARTSTWNSTTAPPFAPRSGVSVPAGGTLRLEAAENSGVYVREDAALGLRGGALQGRSESLGPFRDRAVALGRAGRRERAVPRRMGRLPPGDRASRGLARDLGVQRAHRPQRALRPRHRADRERSDLGARGRRASSISKRRTARSRSSASPAVRSCGRRTARSASRSAGDPGRAMGSTLARSTVR